MDSRDTGMPPPKLIFLPPSFCLARCPVSLLFGSNPAKDQVSMKRHSRPKCGLVIAAVVLVSGVALADTVNFDTFKTGAAPPGWTATKTGRGDPQWEVVADDSAPSKPNVLKQSGVATFPVCFKNDTRIQNGFVEVKFKPISGKVDQAGGVVWRCKDANTYYVARANALEDNVEIYHTVNGRRVSFKEVQAKVSSGVWHTLRVDFSGNRFTVSFDGRKVIEAEDDSIPEPGKVGVWTKADSETLFDDFSFGT